MPSVLDCCGECPPAPPFEAVSRDEIDARLLELETRCADRSIGCVSVPGCEPIAEGCTARAICASGRCVVVEHGCAPRVSSR
jgi:hypothetical protein